MMTDPRYRIAFVHNHLFHYRSPVYRILAREDNISIKLFLGGIDTKAQSDLQESEVNHFVVDTHLHTDRTSPRIRAMLPSIQIVTQIAAWEPHVVVVDGLSSVGTNMVLFASHQLRSKAGFVWWSLGAIPNRSASFRSLIADHLQRWFTQRSCAVLAYSTHGADFFRRLGTPKEKVFVGYNTLDEDSILKSIESNRHLVATLRRDLQLFDSPVAIFSGTINSGKRLDLLLKAFALVRTNNTDLEPILIVMGDGPDLSKMQELTRDLGLDSAVRFVGRQHEMASAYYLLADFAVLPGLGGLAINHAFAHGIPVICGPADGCELDLVKSGCTGIYLPEVTPLTLANAMTELFTNPQYCKLMGESARKLITVDITLQNYAQKILDAVFFCIGKR